MAATPEQLQAAVVQMAEAVRGAVVAAEAAAQAAAASATGAAAAQTAAAGARRPVDGRFADRPKPFDHKDGDMESKEWQEYKFLLVNYLSAIGPCFAAELEEVGVNRNDELAPEDMAPAVADRSILLYTLLASLMRNRALGVVRSTPRKNGFEAWRKLLQTLEPAERGRSLGLLSQLLSKSYWTSTQDFQLSLIHI